MKDNKAPKVSKGQGNGGKKTDMLKENKKSNKKKANRRGDAGAEQAKGPEPPLSPCLFFAREILPKLKANEPGLTYEELGRKLGEAYGDLTPAEMEKYKQLAREDYVRFIQETAAYEAARGGGGGSSSERGANGEADTASEEVHDDDSEGDSDGSD